MTDMEKKVMVRLCAKILSETDLYDTDMEVRNLIDWICVSEQIKSNNNEIRSITGEYKRIEPQCSVTAGAHVGRTDHQGVEAVIIQFQGGTAHIHAGNAGALHGHAHTHGAHLAL